MLEAEAVLVEIWVAVVMLGRQMETLLAPLVLHKALVVLVEMGEVLAEVAPQHGLAHTHPGVNLNGRGPVYLGVAEPAL